MAKIILGIDIGYGDTKCVVLTNDGEFRNQFKFPTMVGITKRNAHIKDKRIYDYKSHSYYVGNDANYLPSKNLIDITEYKNLEYYAPLFLHKAIETIGEIPDIVVTGLSKAQIENSGHFKTALQNFTVNEKSYKFDKLFVLPQGAGSKLAIDKYGMNFPHEQTEFAGATNFVGCDIGFQTLDLYMVTDGKTSPNLFEGIEKEGVMKIAIKVAKKIKEVHNREITLQEGKNIIDTGVYKLRGQKYDMSSFVTEIKKSYLKELLEMIENRYGNILDKCDFIALSGGGSTIFKSQDDGFIRVPKSNHEFMNSLGFGLWGLSKI